MNKWQEEVWASLLDSEEQALSDLEKEYRQALNDIGNQIKLFQSDIDQLNQAINAGGISDADKEILISQARSKAYQKEFQEALQGQINGILDQLHSKEYNTIDSYLHDCYEESYVGEFYNLSRQGLPYIAPINQSAATHAILTDSKVVRGYYSRLGVDTDHLKKVISQEVTRGIATAASYAEIARNINNASRSGLYNAQRIARTEGHRIQNTASRDAANNAVAHGADLVKQWDSTLDGRTRESHVAVDGEIKELDEKFSNGLDRPGDPSGAAEEVINCRCAEIHKPRWVTKETIDPVTGEVILLPVDGFVKMDNFTGELRQFETPEDYTQFKEWYFSKENTEYMAYVAQLEDKYGTKNFESLLGQMNEREYAKFKRLEDASPMWKSLDIISNSDIIKEQYHRKISEDGREIIYKPLFNSLTNEVLKNGGEIQIATNENGLIDYLNSRNATAVTINDLIIFRSDCTTTEVLEEVFHFKQNRSLKNSQYPLAQRQIMNEIEAQKYLIEIADRYKIPQQERQETIGLLEFYENQMKTMKEEGVWID